MEHHGFGKREGTGTGRIINRAQVCVSFNFYAMTGENADPNLKVKCGSYPAKNIPYFIHLFSLHVF